MEYLRWRLHGPIGIDKVAMAILREAQSDEERAFLLGEFALELSQIRPKNAAGCLGSAQIRDALRMMIKGFQKQTKPLLRKADESMRRYVNSALKEAQS